eukprot:3541080-Rhodomonas_salina.1
MVSATIEVSAVSANGSTASINGGRRSRMVAVSPRGSLVAAKPKSVPDIAQRLRRPDRWEATRRTTQQDCRCSLSTFPTPARDERRRRTARETVLCTGMSNCNGMELCLAAATR